MKNFSIYLQITRLQVSDMKKFCIILLRVIFEFLSILHLNFHTCYIKALSLILNSKRHASFRMISTNTSKRNLSMWNEQSVIVLMIILLHFIAFLYSLNNNIIDNINMHNKIYYLKVSASEYILAINHAYYS